MTKKTAIYIDGYNFYYGRLRETGYKWLDVVKLFERIVMIQDCESEVIKINLFTAPALAKFATHGQASVEAQQKYIRALETLHGERLQVTYGNHSYDKSGTLLPTFIDGVPFDRKNRTRVWKIEEKQTDVNLAISMYRDAAKQRYDQIVICSNDSDAEPALIAIKEDFPQIILGVITPVKPPSEQDRHRSISQSLAEHAAWTRRHILDEELESAQLPEKVPTRKKPILKPEHWKNGGKK